MNKNTMELLDVDWVGTKTFAVITDGQGNILAEAEPRIITVGSIRVKEALEKAILAAIGNAGIDHSRVGNVKKPIFALTGIVKC